MTNTQKHLLKHVADLVELASRLYQNIEPQAAYLLTDTAHGEAIIEASEKLREAIAAALDDVKITIAE